MIETKTLESLSELLEQVKSCLIIVCSNPTYDQVAAGLSFSEALQAAGKEVTLISPEEIPTQASTLQGTERFQYKLGNQSLSVKFPYKAESVDKVSYHISDDEETFYLLIKPQKGSPPLESQQVSFDYVGADADMIFLIGVHQLESLDHLYDGFEDLFSRTPLVTIHTFEPEIGNLKIDTSKYAAYSQAMVSILQHLQLPLSSDAATNLLAGIEMVTEGFSSSLTTADTFDAVALLMRQGARRLRPHQLLKKTDAPLGKIEKKESNNEVFLQPSENSESIVAKNNPVKLNQKKKKDTVPKSERPKAESNPGSLDYQPGASGVLGKG